jgi:hypothetical protein
VVDFLAGSDLWNQYYNSVLIVGEDGENSSGTLRKRFDVKEVLKG